MWVTQHTITITTDGDGAATVYSDVAAKGCVRAVIFDVGTLETPTVTVTGSLTGIAVFTKAAMDSGQTFPHATAHSTALADLTFDGTYKIPVPIPLANEKIKVVVAGGGDKKTGTLTVLVG